MKTLFAVLALIASTTAGAAAEVGQQPIPTTRAMQIFDAVCSANVAKQFVGAKTAMTANGITIKDNGTIYGTVEHVSMKVSKPAQVSDCTLVWRSSESSRKVLSQLKAVGIVPTPKGQLSEYNGQAVWLVAPLDPKAS